MSDVEVELPPDVSQDGEQESTEERAKESNACRRCGKQYASRGSLWKHEKLCAVEAFVSGETKSAPDQGKREESPEKESTTKRAPGGRERKPRQPVGKRHDASHILGTVWTQGARFVPSIPAQRAMVWQAPSAGKIIDNALAGSFVDKVVLQKIAGKESKYAPVASLVSLPLMLVLIDKNPSLFPVLLPQLRSVVKDNLAAALSAKAAEKKEIEELEALAAEAGMEWETVDQQTGEKLNLIDSVLQDLLAPFEEVESDGDGRTE